MKKRPRWSSLAGQGFELTAAVIGFGLVGYWVGGYLGSARNGLLIGSVLGIIGGLYNLIRASLREVNLQGRSKQRPSGTSRED